MSFSLSPALKTLLKHNLLVVLIAYMSTLEKSSLAKNQWQALKRLEDFLCVAWSTHGAEFYRFLFQTESLMLLQYKVRRVAPAF